MNCDQITRSQRQRVCEDEFIVSSRCRAHSAIALGTTNGEYHPEVMNGNSGTTANNVGVTNGQHHHRMGHWMMKRLKRRLSQALKPVASAGHLFESLILTNGHHRNHHRPQQDNHVEYYHEEHRNYIGNGYANGQFRGGAHKPNGLSGRRSKSSITLQSPLSVESVAEDPMAELAERLASNVMSVSMYEDGNDYIDEPPLDGIVMRNKQRQSYKIATNGYALREGSRGGARIVKIGARSYSSRTVVQEHPCMGSDGESENPSPSCSDSVASPHSVNVQMRQKSSRRRWSEQDIQKRLSLPADLRLPQSVVEKLNATPALDQPLTRKNRRVSLSEIGFGKLESYQKLEKLGEGTYATVYKGRSRLTDKLVALKEIRLEQEEGAPCTAIREVSLLRDLRHANVVTLHDIIHTDRTLTLVFEYLDRDLKQYMDESGSILSINNVRLFLFQLLRGLTYCHSRRVLHRDLKPQNLLINEMGELKLADFGLARAKSVPTKTYSHEVVTLWYRPPDVLLGSTDYSTYIDMWGVGCILYEMAAGRPFFPGSTTEEQLHLIFRALGTPQQHLHQHLATSPEFLAYRFPNYRPEPLVNHVPRLDADGLELLAQFLQYEGIKRISARNAMRHSFFSCLPVEVYELNDIDSIFMVPGIHLNHNPGRRGGHNQHHHSRYHHRRHHNDGGFGHHHSQYNEYQNGQANSKSRRQSMLL